MSRNDRIARLFRVLNQLATSKRGLPIKALADREGIPLRSLYRDIEAIEKAGFPLLHEDGRYRLLPGWMPATQMGIDEEELLALFLAREQATGWSGSQIGQALDRLYAKLAAAPGKSGTLMPKGLAIGFTQAAPAARDYRKHRQSVATLDRAIRERLLTTAVYEAISGEVTQRRIEPAQLHWDARLEALYLIAYCRLRQDIRVFAAHRFRAVSLGRETFQPRPGVSSQEALRHSFRVWRAAEVVRVQLCFEGRAARLIAERRWHPSQRLRRIGGGDLLFEAEVAGVAEITPWILSFGTECTVLGPDTLAERIREVHLAAATKDLQARPGLPRTRDQESNLRPGALDSRRRSRRSRA
jgi:predicted DNA-binding transcriptional regulator YafY